MLLRTCHGKDDGRVSKHDVNREVTLSLPTPSPAVSKSKRFRIPRTVLSLSRKESGSPEVYHRWLPKGVGPAGCSKSILSPPSSSASQLPHLAPVVSPTQQQAKPPELLLLTLARSPRLSSASRRRNEEPRELFLLLSFPCATQQKHDTPEQPHLTFPSSRSSPRPIDSR